MKVTRYDSSLSICIKTLLEFISSEVLADSAVIRDINGQLGVIVADILPEADRKKIAKTLMHNLGAYAHPYEVVADKNGFDAPTLLDEACNQPSTSVEGQLIHLLDRRVVGMDWLKAPAARLTTIPLLVFASIKGGVGRSTALCVAASHFSRRGRRVLAIDFDLEAPGIGSMLLQENELPQFGSLDFLVESQVGGFGAIRIEDLIGSSYLGSAGARVDVIPAIGSITLEYPQNALGKIARAYLEMQPDDGEGPMITLGGKLNRLVQSCAATGRYDIILVDSRAGLHESTAASMLALGGEVLLFGTNQPQTFQGYSLLFAHLSQFPVNPDDDWRERLTFVHAMSSPIDEAKKNAADRFVDVYRLLTASSVFAKEDQYTSITADDINIVWDDSLDSDPLDEIPDYQILHILNDRNYLDFDPLAKRGLLEIASYEHTYRDLIDYLDQLTVTVEMTFP